MRLTGKARSAFTLLNKAIKRQGILLDEAISELLEDMDGEEGWPGAIEAAKVEFEKRISEIDRGRKPTTFHKRNRLKWYPGPDDEKDKYWPLLKNYLLDDKGWDEDAVQSIDDASTKVVFNLDFPGQPEFKTKGLVLGYVQSGKTANFTAVMSKAADAGFRLFIVLSGMTNSLRQQTQLRIDEELVALDSPTDWLTWTNQDSDIGDLPFDIAAFLDNNKRHIAIVKKNGPRLRRLLRMIREAGHITLSRIPVMIIDDECDQASVNASSVRGRRTAINSLLNELIKELPKVSYVGYTATPYANVLIDPAENDIYPSDFIISLPQPPRYFGAEKLFGRDLLDADPVAPDADGLDMIRLIDDQEAVQLRPARADKDTFTLEVTDTLRESILYYWLATAAREARGGENQHSTMLIHTTVYAQSHKNAIPRIEAFRKIVLRHVQQRSPEILNEMEELWTDEVSRVDATDFGRYSESFEELLQHLARVIDITEIVAENSISDERLDYNKPGRRYIVVGGNVLARGLTIEGLVSSFFLRTSSQYDSLMQMGRWFGYRIGYEDLPRIYMTADLAEYFKDMATVEAELRYEIETYERENLTPSEFAPRIRCHPALAITARNKMLDAVNRQMSFNGRHIQTRKFHHLSLEWLQNNWTAGTDLLDSIQSTRTTARGGDRPLFMDVPYTRVIEFLNQYEVHEAHEDMARDRLCSYIARQIPRADNNLARWNVGVMTGEGDQSETALGHIGRITTVRRSQLQYSEADSADIKALAGLPDATIDFSNDYRAAGKKWRDIAIDRMQQFPDGRPLLLLYPIERMSPPQEPPAGKKSIRKALDAVTDVLGMAIFFPKLDDDEPVGYVSAPIDSSQYEDAEYIEEVLDD